MASEEPACPICGNTQWEQTGEPFVLRRGDPRILRGGGVEVSAYICTACGFIRLHRMSGEPPFAEPS